MSMDRSTRVTERIGTEIEETSGGLRIQLLAHFRRVSNLISCLVRLL